MEKLNFTKMEAAGNDFIIIDNREASLSEKQIISLTPRLCDRRFGIGADGLIALQNPKDSSHDYQMFYRNADGSDAGMCGNGARCLALFAAKLGLENHLTFKVHDITYEVEADLEKNFAALLFPMKVEITEITWAHKTIFQLYPGTEHIVIPVSKSEITDDAYLRDKGEELRYHAAFEPAGTNVNFINGISADEISIKTYERGVEDLTLACGTGAVAGAVAWHHIKKNEKNSSSYITLHADGGTLKVHFHYNTSTETYSNIKLKGEATFVFQGHYEL